MPLTLHVISKFYISLYCDLSVEVLFVYIYIYIICLQIVKQYQEYVILDAINSLNHRCKQYIYIYIFDEMIQNCNVILLLNVAHLHININPHVRIEKQEPYRANLLTMVGD